MAKEGSSDYKKVRKSNKYFIIDFNIESWVWNYKDYETFKIITK